LLAAALAGCNATASKPSHDLLLSDPARSLGAESIIRELPMGGQNIARRKLSDGADSTVFLVRIAERESPHRHTRYDLTVVVVAGSGTLWLDGAPLAMEPGDIAHIPRGTPHYFVNDGDEPASAVAVFSPRFEGPDNQPIAP
jgi:quercetin dioxygenase-like cupin family protein